MVTTTGEQYKNVTSTPVLSNPYILHEQLKFMNLDGFDVGIDAGVTYKKHFFEFQYLYTLVGGGYRAHYYSNALESEPGVNSYISSSFGDRFTRTIHKLSLGYQYEAYRTKNNVFGLRLTANLGFYFNSQLKKGHKAINTYIELSGWPNTFGNGATLDQALYISSSQKRINGFTSFGVGFDFYTKSNRNLFSIDVNYTQGFGRMNYFLNSYTITDNNVTNRYSYYGSGKGSSLNIQLSRRFQLYPWIKIKKKEGREIEKF